MTKKPLIGVTIPDGGQFSAPFFKLAIRLAGGQPLMLCPSSPQFDAPLDGLILSGGTDVHPSHYKSLPKTAYDYDPLRDELEWRWLTQAEAAKLPILGVCRGAQLMNIYRGGDLHMDISKIFEKANYPNGTLARIFYRKGIKIRHNSLLYRIIRADYTRVNSMHTQAINRLGKGLKIAAEERNKIIQGIEDPSFPMFLGVQFHPEYLIYSSRYRRIFSQLTRIARQNRAAIKE